MPLDPVSSGSVPTPARGRASAASAQPTSAPGGAFAEHTSTVVIGSGLSGLAVASELSRGGIDSIVVESLECFDSGAMRTVITDSVSLSERTELMRLLRGYATAHQLDVRQTTVAEHLSIIGHPRLLKTPVGRKKWAVQTADGVLLADHVVLTKYPQSELRKFLRSMGIAVGKDFKAALRAIGLHLVGVGELLTPTTREIVRQAKLVSDAIVAQGPAALARLTPPRAAILPLLA